jgi:hypothetical protein
LRGFTPSVAVVVALTWAASKLGPQVVRVAELMAVLLQPEVVEQQGRVSLVALAMV